MFQNAKVYLLAAPIRKITLQNNIEKPSWFDAKKIGGENQISKEHVKESMNIVEEVIKKEIKVLGDSKKIILGGFS